ncbi:DsbA family oxidoreductase [Bacillus massiliigorillae]|uniref:DsbA family oxidoreductase n=1 Tax=Bacillus massiliigorillae TaxID=1243664 RepID=UPI0005A9A828|nr:DsbA family protein [Bacillus massiliigorillae]
MNMNNMNCDLQTGICGDAGEDAVQLIDFNTINEKITVYYVTDPICSHCWALEPVLRRFEKQYGQYFNIQTVMGGLLESWNGFADVKNGIGKPADVAGHWREVGEHARMPIDGSLWLTNPIQSSYPPSRVFKVIQQKDEQLATTFLRRTREAVFVFNQNIGEASVLIEIVNQLNLDGEAILKEAEQGKGQQLLEQDFALARSLGVRGFPSIIMINKENKGTKIVGARPLEYYLKGLEQTLAKTSLQPQAPSPLSQLLEKEVRLFSKEIEVMYDLTQSQIQSFIQKELDETAYSAKTILNELYIEIK